jgi:hypothetical protein
MQKTELGSAYKHTKPVPIPRCNDKMCAEGKKLQSKHERMNEQFLTLMMFSMQFHTARKAKKVIQCQFGNRFASNKLVEASQRASKKWLELQQHESI